MIWHIFRKDWKLLWPLVATVAVADVLNAALQLTLAHFDEPPELTLVAQLFPLALFLGIAALIVTCVHQDALPGVRQDWLVRPIRRRDLILAKLLFVLVAVHGPMLLADLAHGLATGFTLWGSISAALSRGGLLVLSFSLPVLGLATMTSTFVEVTAGVLAIWLIAVAIIIGVQILARGSGAPPLASSGLTWMTTGFWSLVALAAAVVIIPLQYFRRATLHARGIALAAVLLAPAPTYVAWAQAFSFQQWLSADPAAARPVAVTFDPSLGNVSLEPGVSLRPNSVQLPVRFSGLAPESIVMTDRAIVSIIGRDGALLYRGRTTGEPVTALGNFSTASAPPDPVASYGAGRPEAFSVRTTTGGEVRAYQVIILPRRLYERAGTQPVRMELDYSLTLFRIHAADKIAAVNGDKRIRNFGWCKTRIDADGDEVELGCLTTGSAPTCATAILENAVDGRRNPASDICDPDYRPYPAHFIPDAMSQFGGGLRFRDPRGLAKFPVDGSQLADAQVIVKTYHPVAHFTRHLVIPEIRLSDWVPGAEPTKDRRP